MTPKSSSLPQKCGNFELKCSVTANELIPVHKFVSNKTGLTAVIAEVEGPLVNGYFCLATEAHDDDGLPHTLEHLIFLGSEKYPYKGVLDLLANRCLASGTNAWTDTDHTCYTMTTAGSEGFLSLMPIYLEHILYPTLTDAGFCTEVYHINGEGKDGGVVFTEMQGVENTGPRRVSYELNKLMYPGRCGYKSETGGAMQNLRESTNNTKIKEFHKKFYRPENLYVIVVGSVEPLQVLQSLETVEDIISSKGDRGEFIRPWQSPVPPVAESADILVPYPSDEEDHGMVYIGWRGPSVVNEYYKFSACVILLKYLTDTAVSPLPKEFVDIPEPYASKVSYTPIENNESEFIITFDNVPMDKLDQIKDKLDLVFQSIVSSPQPFDMKRLQTVLNRYRLESLASLENTPHESIAYTIIGYMLHGRTIDDLDHRLNFMRDLDKMAAEPEKFWVDLLKEVFVDGKRITVRGCPRIDEQKRLAAEEKERVEKRLAELGKDGLEAKERAIRDAMVQNDIPPPCEMLVSVPIPSTESIQFHGISSFNSESSVVDPRFDTSKVPLYVNVDNLKTNFVYVFVLMDTSKVQPEFRAYLPPLLECLLESPIQRGDTIIPYEEVVAQLEEDTIAASGRVGPTSVKPFTCGPFPQTACLLLQLEAKKYEKAVEWVTDILYNTVITDDRIKILASKIVNNVAEVKRNGSYMSQEITRGLMYSKNSNHFAASALYQQKALTHMLARMKSVDESLRVVEEFKALRAQLTQPENMVLHIMANLDTLSQLCPDLAEPWRTVLPQSLSPIRRKLHVVPDWQLLAESANAESCVVGVGAVESAFLCHTSPCTKDFNDSELAILLVFFQYFTQLEGPMWKQIRGQGLAYSYNIVPRPNESKLYFTLYRASNVVGAYKTAKAVIESSFHHEWDPTLFDSAKTSLIFEIVQREKCIGDVVVQSLLAAFKGVTNDYNRQFVRQIAKVSINDVTEIAGKYVTHMFNPQICKTSVICHPSKVEEVTKGLNETGLCLKSYSSVDDAFPHLWKN